LQIYAWNFLSAAAEVEMGVHKKMLADTKAPVSRQRPTREQISSVMRTDLLPLKTTKWASGVAIPEFRPRPGDWISELYGWITLCNLISAAVFLFLGMGVYQAWVYCVTGRPKLRWLFLKNP
jgi:hypothetical protein